MEGCGVGVEGLCSDCVWAVEWDMLRGVDEDSSDVTGEGVSGNSTIAEEFEGTIADVSRLVGNKEVLSDGTTDWETLTEDGKADAYCNSEFLPEACCIRSAIRFRIACAYASTCVYRALRMNLLVGGKGNK